MNAPVTNQPAQTATSTAAPAKPASVPPTAQSPQSPQTPTKPATPTTPVVAKSVVPTKPVQASLTPSASKAMNLAKPPPFKMSTPNTSVTKWLKMLVYARPGAGKTTLCMTAVDVPQMNDVLLINADKGDIVLEENTRIKNPQLLRDNIIECNDFKTAAMVHDFLKMHCKFRDEDNVKGLREYEAWLRGCKTEDIVEPKRFRTVIIDSLTELDIYCTYGLLGLTQENVLHGEASDIEVARFDEFRKNNQMVQMFSRAFRDLPIHVLSTSHEAYTEDEQRKKHYMPQLTGQLRTQITGFYDIVGYLTYKKEGEIITRQYWVQPVGPFHAKNRRSVFKDNFFKDPVMMDIMKGCQLLKPELPKENAAS